jgi:(2Fe-2S) ferredoxin
MGQERMVLVCQYRSCRKEGSEAVLSELLANPVDGVVVQGTGCLGLCGAGTIVLVVPDQIYYWRVKPSSVPRIISEHLLNGQPVSAMLHPRLHPI